MIKIFLVAMFVLTIGGCAGVSDFSSGSFRSNPPLLIEIDDDQFRKLYESRSIGTLQLYKAQSTKGRSSVFLYGPKTPNGLTGPRFDLGLIGPGERVDIHLPPGEYFIHTDSSSTVKGVITTFEFLGGETLGFQLTDLGRPPAKDSRPWVAIKKNAEGLLYDLPETTRLVAEYKRFSPPAFAASTGDVVNGSVPLRLRFWYPETVDRIMVNGHPYPLQKVDELLVLTQKVQPGENTFQVTVTGKNGLERTEQRVVTVMTDAQRQARRDAEANASAAKAQAERVERQRAEEEAARKRVEEERIAREGDGSQDDLLCKKYGLRPSTDAYGQCRLKLDLARQESKRQAEQYERERLEYERRLAAIERENERRKALNQIELGFRLLGGQNPVDAVNSVGTGAPIAPRPPAPVFHNITLPNGSMVTCTTNGTFTSCN